MLYLTNPSGDNARAAMAAGHIGAIMTPRQGNKLPACSVFCIDNGCGPGKDVAGAGYPGDEAYIALLRALGQGEGFDEYDPFTSGARSRSRPTSWATPPRRSSGPRTCSPGSASSASRPRSSARTG
jgi:hypothetical protein